MSGRVLISEGNDGLERKHSNSDPCKIEPKTQEHSILFVHIVQQPCHNLHFHVDNSLQG